MRIFSNFDTKFREKVLAKALSKYSSEEVLVLRRSRYYFFFRVLFPFILLVFLALGFHELLSLHPYLEMLQIPGIAVWLIVMWVRPGFQLMRYLYDFTIIDPQGIFTYKQRGILKSYIKQIPSNRIRSIEIERSNILENVFGYGKINILTDFMEHMHIGGDDESPNIINITYVDKPYKVKNQITDICFK